MYSLGICSLVTMKCQKHMSDLITIRMCYAVSGPVYPKMLSPRTDLITVRLCCASSGPGCPIYAYPLMCTDSIGCARPAGFF